MGVVAEEGEIPVADECGNPQVVGWDRRALGFQIKADVRIVRGDFGIDACQLGCRQVFRKPLLVSFAMP